MTKLFSPLRASLCIAALAALGGCELYLGDSNGGGDRWTYCANDGYYVCNGSECEWAGSRCPQETGYTCDSDSDCAQGCYCSDDGVCEEAGFCNNDNQCPDGYTCDEARASCVPETCVFNEDCDQGEVCSDGRCETTCTCTNDQEAIDAGYGYCNESRGTCEPTLATGSCAGAVTCNTAEPACAPGEVAVVLDGCYTGVCNLIGTCDLSPECTKLQHESDCLGRAGECTSVYYGVNCTNPSNGGASCQAGDSGCVCESFQFADCRTSTTAATMQYEGPNGTLIDMFSRN